MPSIRLTKDWQRWAGPLSDIADVTGTAQALLAKPDGKEPSTAIAAELPGRDVEAGTWEEFRSFVDSRDVEAIQSLRVSIGSFDATNVRMRFRRDYMALTLEVAGDDRTQVAGVYNELSALLNRGKQLGSNFAGPAQLVCIVALPAATLVVLIATGVLHYIPENAPPSERASLWFVIGLVFLLVAEGWIGNLASRRLFPTLEFLREGQAAAIDRFRAWIVAGVVALVLGVAASYVYGLTQ